VVRRVGLEQGEDVVARGLAVIPGRDPHDTCRDRDPVAGDGHADDGLGQVVSVVRGLAMGTETAFRAAAPGSSPERRLN
jgi:hypothetical protein